MDAMTKSEEKRWSMDEGSGRRRGVKNQAMVFASSYHFEPNTRVTERIAHFLFEAKKKLPGHFFAHSIVAKAILGLPKVPHSESPNVESVRGAITGARKIMRDRYGCSIEVEKGLGMRATVDDTDQANTRVRKAAIRVVSAEKTLAAEAKLVDVGRVKDETTKKWLNKHVVPTLKLLELEGRIDKLLPPKKDQEGA